MGRRLSSYYKWIGCIALTMTSHVLSSQALAEVSIVVHPSTSTNSASAAEIARLFLGKTNTLPDGTKMIPLDQDASEDVRQEFYKKIAKKAPSQLNAYWSRLIFTGKGQPPKAVLDDDEVLELVSSNPNLIGYVSEISEDTEVKVILTVP